MFSFWARDHWIDQRVASIGQVRGRQSWFMLFIFLGEFGQQVFAHLLCIWFKLEF
jgi:hypothetical protein